MQAGLLITKKIKTAIKGISNKKLPIMLLHQKNDKLISIENGKMIYAELKKQGFANVHFVTLTSGSRNDLCDNQAYDALQAFYAKYLLPYDQARYKLVC